MVEDTMFSGESKNIEYKVSLPDKSEKYMKTIVAFANTQGGKLIVGVDDKTHQIVGVENDVLFQLMDGIANAVSDSCVPQIIPDIEPQTVSGKTVIVSLLLACLRKLILLIPLIFILPHFIQNKVFAVFLAEPISDILAAIITTSTFFSQFNKILDRK